MIYIYIKGNVRINRYFSLPIKNPVTMHLNLSWVIIRKGCLNKWKSFGAVHNMFNKNY